MKAATAIDAIDVRTYVFPTPQPEADGTLQWSATTAVTVQATAGGVTGLGWSYTDAATAYLITGTLADVATGRDAFDLPGSWEAMVRACRNLGRPGLVSHAVAAVDIALWDLKARLLEVPLSKLFGRCRDTVPVYGSGGFTTLDDDDLTEQVEGWLAAGCNAVKIKVGESWGSQPQRDLRRTQHVRSLVGDRAAVMVDANGGYSVGQACRMATAYDDLGVVWIEEPVSSDHLDGLATVRAHCRADVAAGEYGDSVFYFRAMCAADAVDCVQLDVTRCAGYTEWLRCAAVAASHGLQVSAHCAPALHAPVAAAVPNLRHVEWFVDHVRLEPLLLQGVPSVIGGEMVLTDAVGHGMTLNPDAERWRSGGG